MLIYFDMKWLPVHFRTITIKTMVMAYPVMVTLITMTSQWAWWRLKSPASRLFIQPFFQAYIKQNIKAPRHWPCEGNSQWTGEFPAQMASNAENVSIWWRHNSKWLQVHFRKITIKTMVMAYPVMVTLIGWHRLGRSDDYMNTVYWQLTETELRIRFKHKGQIIAHYNTLWTTHVEHMMPVHQNPWYWLCSISKFLSDMRKDFTTCVMSMWRNCINCRYILCVQQHIKG